LCGLTADTAIGVDEVTGSCEVVDEPGIGIGIMFGGMTAAQWKDDVFAPVVVEGDGIGAREKNIGPVGRFDGITSEGLVAYPNAVQDVEVRDAYEAPHFSALGAGLGVVAYVRIAIGHGKDAV